MNIKNRNIDYGISLIISVIVFVIVYLLFVKYDEPLIFLVCFIILPIDFIVEKINNSIREKRKYNIKQNGILIESNFVEVVDKKSIDFSAKRRFMHTRYYIICEGFNSLINSNVKFKSDEISLDPSEYIKDHNITKFNVYLYNNKYYVDMEDIQNNILSYTIEKYKKD